MSYFQQEDIRIHYQIYESNVRSCDTIVLLHGVGLSAASWNWIIPYLTSHSRVVALDLRGHGLSERGTKPISWRLFVDDLRALLLHLNIGRVHLMGHGFGANVALKYSMNYIQDVSSLILIAIPIMYPKKTAQKLLSNRKQLTADGSMSKLAYRMAQSITLLDEGSPIFQAIIADYSLVEPKTYLDIIELYANHPPRDDLKFTQSPILLLAGDRDPVYLASMHISSQMLMNKRLLIVPEASNAIFIDQPEATAKWVNKFIAQPIMDNYRHVLMNEASAAEVFGAFEEMIEAGVKQVDEENTLHVDFLDSFRVRVNGAEVVEGWNKRYAKNLLIYLVLHPTSTREQLCDALFPDRPLRQALNNLKVYLHYLKGLLTPSETDKPLLYMDKQYVALQGAIKSDVLSLIQKLVDVANETETIAKQQAAGRLLAALPTVLMPGVYDDWIIPLRESLENQTSELAKYEWLCVTKV